MTAAADREVRTPGWQEFVAGVRAFVASRVPPADAEDVAQEVFVRLQEGADGLRDDARVRAWTFTIARRTIADYYRRRSPETEAGDGSAELADGDHRRDGRRSRPSPGDDPVAHEAVLSWLRPMAESLPERYRIPLLMADFEGHTQREVADRLGLSLSGAKSRVQRARSMLTDRLLECCAFELDEAGRVARYERRTDGCETCRPGG